MSLTEKINLWRAKARSGVHPLWKTILATDLATQVPELQIPVYFFHGISDYTVSYPLAKEYFKCKIPFIIKVLLISTVGSYATLAVLKCNSGEKPAAK
jgi:hypothetical protein